MRRILVDHARAAKADKRGGGAAATPLVEIQGRDPRTGRAAGARPGARSAAQSSPPGASDRAAILRRPERRGDGRHAQRLAGDGQPRSADRRSVARPQHGALPNRRIRRHAHAERWQRSRRCSPRPSTCRPTERDAFVGRETAGDEELAGELSGMLAARPPPEPIRSPAIVESARGRVRSPSGPAAGSVPIASFARSAAAAWASCSRRCARRRVSEDRRAQGRAVVARHAASCASASARAADPGRARASQHRAAARRRHRRRHAVLRHGVRRGPADHRLLRRAARSISRSGSHLFRRSARRCTSRTRT